VSAFLISSYDIALIALQWLGGEVGKMGFGYFVANIVIFVVVQPSLIVMFFLLCLHQRKKNKLMVAKLNLAQGSQND
jgi:uncharacterized membrane protein